ncbi:MAG TPA: glycosyltransferase family 4 protein [Burkholderiales bacterium]|nr:glycosyltransferase family 4 protein [Burkholderiales bacterium]
MKVAIVRQRYSPYGGAERFVAQALPALERAGMEMTLISRKQQGWGARRFLRADPFHLGNLWRDWSFARAARKAWQREHFDVVQSHERIPGCDVYRAGDGVHRRWLALRRAAAGPLERLGMALNPYHRYVCEAEKRMLEHPRLRAVICNSKMVREEIQRDFRVAPEKLHVIYNGVDLEHFHPRHREALRGAARAELGCSARDTVFVFVGSGFSRKGLDAAVAAVSGTPFRLLVVGRDRVKSHAHPRVKFVGGQQDVRPYYAAADCFLLPSRYDPFPNTALEALAMGLPAIVSARCGAAEVIEPGVNGWICQPDDVAGIARLLQEADSAVGTGRPMGKAARATAERFGFDAMARQLVELYGKLHDD